MTVLASGLPQILDEGKVAPQAMDSDKNWHVTLEQEDMLVFSLAPNGTVMMRAVSSGEWEERQGSDPSRPITDPVRNIVSANNAAGPVSSDTGRSEIPK
jgi:hypothetical protein